MTLTLAGNPIGKQMFYYSILAEIPAFLFCLCYSLEIYTFKNIYSGQVRGMTFHRLAHLIRLDLSTCQISVIESGAFDGLLAIQRIYLHGNHLSTISAGDLPPSLHGISVYDNR